MLLPRSIVALAFSLAVFTAPAMADSCASQGVIQGVATAFQSAARSGSADAFASAASRYADVNGLAMFALGQYRGKLQGAQQGKYLTLARGFMGRFMAQNSSRIPSSPFSITACSGNMVTAKFDSGGSITFRMAGSSRIADVTISGVSVAGAMRNKFTSVIDQNNGDVNALLAYLAK